MKSAPVRMARCAITFLPCLGIAPSRRRKSSTTRSTASISTDSSRCPVQSYCWNGQVRRAATSASSAKMGHLGTKIVAHLGWGRWIKRAVGARDAKRDKPAPDPIFMALDGTGIAPDSSVWMVGDTPADLQCAHAAGVLPVFFGSVELMAERLKEFPPGLHALDCHELAALL